MLIIVWPADAAAQLSARLPILQAEDRRAPTFADLATIRAAARSSDPQTAQIGLRALGRLERPSLVPDILPALRHPLPEVRAEAANAIAQAAQGLAASAPVAGMTPASIQSALIARLNVEADPDVKAALCESLARLPYVAAADVARAESTLVDVAKRASSNTDRLGVAKAFEALARMHRSIHPLETAAVEQLRSLVRDSETRPEQERLRDARVRRLALEALITSDAVDLATLKAAAADPDPQARRLAVHAATLDGAETIAAGGLTDPAPMVRIEALRTARTRDAKRSCVSALEAAADPDMNVVTVALDQLGSCTDAPSVADYLAQAVADVSDAEAPRNWHRAAHALAALAAVAPDRATPLLPAYSTAHAWQLRAYAARAAAVLHQRDALERLARDADDNVAEAAISGLSRSFDHAADEQFVAALTPRGCQVVRAAALALSKSPHTDLVVPALKDALGRFDEDSRPGAMDVRAAVRATLTSLGAPVKPPKAGTQPAAPLNAGDLRRLAAPRARFTIRDVGTFDVALFTVQAPATVLQFAQLVASGYYNGLTFHRVVPNGVVRGGSPGASSYVSDAPLMRDEVGMWPHVRGALGIPTRGRDTGDGQIFIDLVDNPRFDHTYTVFAQVLNGMDIVDRILEGDVIERVDIVP